MTDEQTKLLKQDLFELSMQARREGKWLRCTYQNLWFSPYEIETKWREGQFLWGRVNWELSDPEEQLKQLERECNAAIRALDSFKARLI